MASQPLVALVMSGAGLVPVDGDHRSDAELADVADVVDQVRTSFLLNHIKTKKSESDDIPLKNRCDTAHLHEVQRFLLIDVVERLAGSDIGSPAVHLQSPHRGHDDRTLSRQRISS